MKKRNFLVGLLVLLLVPFTVNAESKTVTTEEELRNALADTTVTEIVLANNIVTEGKINVTRDVTIDGQAEYGIVYGGEFFATADGEGVADNTVWSKKSSDGTAGAVYVLQAYQCKVTLKDMLLMGGNRGLGINGAEVTLEGMVTFSHNGFQDIELGRGTGVTETSKLILTEGAIVVSSEEDPADVTTLLVYVDDAEGQVVLEDGTIKTYEVGTSLTAADLATDLVYLIESDSENTTVSKEYFENLANSNNFVGIGSYAEDGTLIYAWEFLGEDITEPMTLDAAITFTVEAPNAIKADVEKLVANYQNLSYLNFAHDGTLPGKVMVVYNVSAKYEDGTKLYVAHYNETTKALEEPVEVTVEAGMVAFEITECSSYVLYTGVDTTTDADTNDTTPDTSTSTATPEVENVKTGDMNLLLVVSLIAVTGFGLVVTAKKIFAK